MSRIGKKPMQTVTNGRNERSTMLRILEIHLDLPDTASEESLRVAEGEAKEAAIVALQQRGDLSIRQSLGQLAEDAGVGRSQPYPFGERSLLVGCGGVRGVAPADLEV